MADVELPPSEQLLYTTVRIEATDGKRVGTGTGFLYRFVDDGEKHVPAIVTNRHVVEGFTHGTFHLNVEGGDGYPMVGKHVPVTVDNFEGRWIPHPDHDVDLCVMPIAPILNGANAQGKKPFFRMLSEALLMDQAQLDELLPIEDVAMVGYPSGIWDDANNRPIVRRGITATAPNVDYRGKAEFMIDAACFPGSSGSPVFLFNQGIIPTRSATKVGTRIALLGILYAGPQFTAEGEIVVKDIPTAAKPFAVSKIMMNLGYCIKARKLLDFDPIFQKLLEEESG